MLGIFLTNLRTAEIFGAIFRQKSLQFFFTLKKTEGNIIDRNMCSEFIILVLIVVYVNYNFKFF